MRNAFAEVLKQLCKAQVLNMVKAGCVHFEGKLVQLVFVNHMHDEALMRYRSLDKAETQTGVVAPAKTFSRGRYSKIQNNAISVSLLCSASIAFVKQQAYKKRQQITTLIPDGLHDL